MVKYIFIPLTVIAIVLLTLIGPDFSKISVFGAIYSLDLWMLFSLVILFYSPQTLTLSYQLIKLRPELFIAALIAILYIISALLENYIFKIVLFQGAFFIYFLWFIIFFNFFSHIDFKKIIPFLINISLIKLVLVLFIWGSNLVGILYESSGRERMGDGSLLSLMFFIFPLLLLRKKYLNNFQFIALLFFFIISNIMIFHRTLWVGLILVFFFFAYLKHQKVFNTIVKFSFFIVVLISFSSFFPYGRVILNMVVNSATIEDDQNTNARFELSRLVVNDAVSNMNILGNGFGKKYKYSLQALNLKKEKEEEDIYFGLHHNSILSILYYLGWVPFILFLFFLFRTIKLVASYRDVGINIDELLLFGSPCIGWIMFISGNVALETPYYSFYFWLCYGAAYAAIYKINVKIKKLKKEITEQNFKNNIENNLYNKIVLD